MLILYDGNTCSVVAAKSNEFRFWGVARWHHPRWLIVFVCRVFAKHYRLAMEEAEFPITSYMSLEALFTRKLKVGCRPIQGKVCAPADGRLVVIDEVQDGLAVQAKGIDYKLSELIWGKITTNRDVDFTRYLTVYLAPQNYHRVHLPMDGLLTAVRYSWNVVASEREIRACYLKAVCDERAPRV